MLMLQYTYFSDHAAVLGVFPFVDTRTKYVAIWCKK